MVILYLEHPLAFPRVFPDGVSGRESSYQCRRCGFDPRIRKIPWNMRWNSTPVFLPGKFHGQKSLPRLQSMGPQRVRHNWTTKHTAYSDITSLSLVVISQSVQSLSRVWLSVTPWTAACQNSLSISKFTQTHVHWVGDAIQPYYPLSSPSPPAFSLFQHQGLFK